VRFFSAGFGIGRIGGGGTAFACFATGFSGLAGGLATAFFGGGAAFFAGLRAGALTFLTRTTTFFFNGLAAGFELFFAFAFAIMKKEWRSIAVSRFPVEGFRANVRQSV
jgi:hypothetical protein